MATWIVGGAAATADVIVTSTTRPPPTMNSHGSSVATSMWRQSMWMRRTRGSWAGRGSGRATAPSPRAGGRPSPSGAARGGRSDPRGVGDRAGGVEQLLELLEDARGVVRREAVLGIGVRDAE